MKKLSIKTHKILGIIIVAITLIILIFSICGLIKKIKDQKEIEATMSMQDYSEETDEEEINIEDLEEYIAEESNNETNYETVILNKPNNKEISTGSRYYIKVNYGANVVTIYSKDENGQYTVPVKAMICSTGTATPKSGTYSIKSRWRWLALFGGVYGQYSTQIVGNILFHSVPYLKKDDQGSLEYWEYDKLGTSCSAGCIRLTVSDAKWIYNNISTGTLVEFYSSSNPGPLGKPSAKKISGNTECRNWDPTDDNANNPWKTYVEKDVKTEDNKKEKDKKNTTKKDKTNNNNNNNTNTNTNTNANANANANTNTNTPNNTNTNTNTDTNTEVNNNTNVNQV